MMHRPDTQQQHQGLIQPATIALRTLDAEKICGRFDGSLLSRLRFLLHFTMAGSLPRFFTLGSSCPLRLVPVPTPHICALMTDQPPVRDTTQVHNATHYPTSRSFPPE